MARCRTIFWRKCSATCGVLSALDRLSRASPTFSAAAVRVLHSPDTMASIAARTLLEMRRGLVPGSTTGAGWSSAARARLAGGVIFSMPYRRHIAVEPQRTKRHGFKWALPDSRKPARGSPGRDGDSYRRLYVGSRVREART